MRSIGFILSFFLHVCVFGQFSTLEWSVLLGGSKDGELVRSMPEDIDREAVRFVGLSAYTLDMDAGDVELEYRSQVGGKWGPWRAFQRIRHGRILDRIAFEAPQMDHAVDKIALRSNYGTPMELVVRLFVSVRGAETNTHIELRSPENCSCEQPDFCSRACWCPSGDCEPKAPAAPTEVSHFIVHHTAGQNTSTDYKAVVAYYWDLHVNTNGWDDIGYNWLIDPNGVIYEGRPSGRRGAHFSCMNGGTLGIAMIGNFEEVQPSQSALDRLDSLLAWEACDKDITAFDRSVHAASGLNLYHISGHRDGNEATTGCPKGTVCPGKYLYAKLPTVRADVSARECLEYGVDIRIEDVRLSSVKVKPGDSVRVSCFQRFTGFKALEVESVLSYYLLADCTEEPSFSPFDTDTSVLSQANNRVRESTVLHISPLQFFANTMYLKIVADSDDQIAEHDESNNSACVELFIDGLEKDDKLELFHGIKLYPVPTNGYLQIEGIPKNAGRYEVEIFDALGQVVYKEGLQLSSGYNSLRLDLSGLAAGTYTMRIRKDGRSDQFGLSKL